MQAKVEVVREPQAIDIIIEMLRQRGAEVFYLDPNMPALTSRATHAALESDVPKTEVNDAGHFACLLITTDHHAVDFYKLVENAKLVVETRNAMRGLWERWGNKIVSLSRRCTWRDLRFGFLSLIFVT